MDITFSLFEVLLIIGITHGFIISVIIWIRKRKESDKILLSVVLTVFNFICLKMILFVSGLWQSAFFRYFPLPFDLAVQPLIFLYINSLTSPGFHFNKKHLIHFIPFTVSLIYSLFIYVSVFPHTNLDVKDNIANHFLFNQVKGTEDFLSVCSAVIYWYGGLKFILRYRKWLYNSTSNTLFPTYEWVRNIIVLFGIFFLMLTINIVLDYSTGYGVNHFFHWQILFIYMAILIYYLGFRGYQVSDNQLSSLSHNQQKQASLPVGIRGKRESDKTGLLPEAEQIITIGKEDRSTDPKYKAAGEAILKLMSEERLYLDPELSLQTLAQKLKLSPLVASAVINSELKKNFRNLINEYRVKEVKVRLNDPRSSQLSLLGIAYECGFNSEASFYRIFKNIVGLSPKEYLTCQQKG